MLWEVDIYPAPGEPDRASLAVKTAAAELGLGEHLGVVAAHGYLLQGKLDLGTTGPHRARIAGRWRRRAPRHCADWRRSPVGPVRRSRTRAMETPAVGRSCTYCPSRA